MNTTRAAALLCIAAAMSNVAKAGEWDITGFLGVDTRVFWEDARFDDQVESFELSGSFQPEAYWRSADGKQRISLVGFARVDSNDSERSHADIRQAYWSYDAREWDVTVGINKVFWGVAESLHLVDVINQTDLVEDIDQEDKLGQPMLNFNLQRDFGRLEFFVLPWFRERTFAGSDGRLRAPLPIDADDPIYESGDGQENVDFAFRYSHYIGDLDIGVSIFDGTSREARVVLAAEGDRLLPYYEQMTQVGVDFQYTNEAWLWKFEAINRITTDDSFQALVGGFEYSFYGLRGGSADLGLLLEYSYDGRSANAPLAIFNDDVFVGARYALNDAQDSSILAGFVLDLNTGELFLNVEAERRIGDSLSAELRIRAFANAAVGDASYSFENDDYIQLRLNWYY